MMNQKLLPPLAASKVSVLSGKLNGYFDVGCKNVIGRFGEHLGGLSQTRAVLTARLLLRS